MYSREGSLRSPPARPSQFFEIINHLFKRLKSQKSNGAYIANYYFGKFNFRTALCSKKHIFERCGGARRAQTENGSYPDHFFGSPYNSSLVSKSRNGR